MSTPIVFSINNDYVRQLSVAIISIISNYSGSDCLNFFVLHKNISQENKNILSDLCNKNNSVINFIDVSNYVNDNVLESLMSKRKNYTYISTETWYRFLIPQLFSQYDKILYLDSDLIVIDDLQKIFDIDITDKYAAVVHDTFVEQHYRDGNLRTSSIPWYNYKDYGKMVLGKKNESYFNAGVMLLNPKKMQNDNIQEKLWAFAKYIVPLEFQDQDVLNAVLEENVLFIKDTWNVLHGSAKSCNYQLSDISIIHFVGRNKPWVSGFKNYNFSFVKKWWEYYKKSPYFKEADLETYESILSTQDSSQKSKPVKKKSIYEKLFGNCIENDHVVRKFFGIKFKFRKSVEVLHLEKKISSLNHKLAELNKVHNKDRSLLEQFERKIILDSGLFDPVYYVKNYHPNLSKWEALDYYVKEGYKRKESPSKEFNAEKYIGINKSINPIIDYYIQGRLRYARAFWKNEYPASEESIEQYLKLKSTRKANKVMYTCITNNYDDLEEIKGFKYIDPDFDYVCFTDNKEQIDKGQIGIWEIRPLVCDKYSNSINNRYHKIFPNILFPEYAESVYIDGNINFLTSKFFDLVKDIDKDIYIPKHPNQIDIYRELIWVCKAGYNTLEFSQKLASRFRDEGFPANYGLFENNIIYRKHFSPEVIEMMNEWWTFMEEGSKRDQVALAYIFWKHNRAVDDYAFENPRISYNDYHIFVHKNERI